MYPTIEIIEVGLLDLKIVDKPMPDQNWGFLIQPNFQEDGVNLRIRFELIFPINANQHIFCKTITGFFLENFNADYLKNETETITGLIQTAMANTRLLVMNKYKNFNYIQMKYFDNKFFIDELKRQIKEQNI
jgi:hypothetical protein